MGSNAKGERDRYIGIREKMLRVQKDLNRQTPPESASSTAHLERKRSTKTGSVEKNEKLNAGC